MRHNIHKSDCFTAVCKHIEKLGELVYSLTKPKKIIYNRNF